MKNRTVQLISGLIFFCIPFLCIGQDFEGIIHFKIPEMTEQGMGEMPYMIKSSKARMEFGQGQQKGAMLLLPEKSKMVILIDAMKGYMSINTEDNTGMEDYSDTKASKTGEIKSIADKKCEVWKIDSEEDIIEACMTQGMGSFMMPKNPMGQDNTPQWAKELLRNGAMPLEVIQVANGERTIKMKAVKIEEKSLSADLFEIPDGYRDMSGMMRQMRNQN